MNTSILIAQILAIVYLSIAFGILINPKYYTKAFKEIMNSAVTVYLGGIMALVAGFFIVKFHNIWIKDWVVLITVIGWGALLKGVALLAFPDQFISMFDSWFKKKVGKTGFIILVIGLIFGYFGFLAQAI